MLIYEVDCFLMGCRVCLWMVLGGFELCFRFS